VEVAGSGRRLRGAVLVVVAAAVGVWLVAQLGLLRPFEAPLRALLSDGVAIEGLLRRSWERGFGDLWSLPILLVVAALTLPVAWHRNLRTGVLLTLCAMVATVAAGAALLAIGPIAIPMVEMLAVELVILVAVVWRRTVQSDSALASLLSDTNQSLRELTGPASFTTAPQHWSLVVTALDQTLTLDRVIILEAVPGQHKVRELSALRCSIDDVVERRRDMRRPPYSTALFRRAPLRVDRGQRSFLSRCAEGEQQYLVPLLFGREVFGFLAVGFGSDDDTEDERFVSQLQGFADQIAELLYLRSRGVPTGATPQQLPRPLAFDPESEVQRAVMSTVQLMGRRITRLQRLLARVSTDTIVYDLFGRVLEANPAMLETLEHEGLVAHELTALDITEALTGEERDHLRELLRHVVLEGGETSLPAALQSQPERSLVLRLRPLAGAAPGAVAGGRQSARFDVAGVVCELVDVSAQVRLAILEGRLGEPVLCLPVDGSSALEQAVEDHRQALAEHGHEIDLAKPRLSPLVFASPEHLAPLYGAVLETLAAASAPGTLSVEVVSETGDRLQYRFAAEDGAVDPAVFEAGESGDDGSAPGLPDGLARARCWARAWGGDLEVGPLEPAGLVVTVELRCFL
jgi:hypothetical protein